MAKANRAKSTAASSQAADMSPVDDMEVDNVEGNDGGNINIVGFYEAETDGAMDPCEKLAQLIQESHTSKKRKVPIRSTIHMMEKLSLDNKDEESNELDPSYLKMTF
ncbi:hypothetical protein SeMB42_g04781 [Synchytrium endobioticum]|uniref:Uncharacterized protein n=1 Tax=Synchytrium endobioticum TaxID=286115 RepID=A0A507CVR5_9FUNG|nr:hypothetical protein SeMB42_g04781 [Synchytrium endobioticum]